MLDQVVCIDDFSKNKIFYWYAKFLKAHSQVWDDFLQLKAL